MAVVAVAVGAVGAVGAAGENWKTVVGYLATETATGQSFLTTTRSRSLRGDEMPPATLHSRVLVESRRRSAVAGRKKRGELKVRERHSICVSLGVLGAVVMSSGVKTKTERASCSVAKGRAGEWAGVALRLAQGEDVETMKEKEEKKKKTPNKVQRTLSAGSAGQKAAWVTLGIALTRDPIKSERRRLVALKICQ